MTSPAHTPVLLKEVLEILDPKPGMTIIDCTLGAGGHSIELAKKGANIIGIDRDEEILEIAEKEISQERLSDKIKTKKGIFSNLKELAGGITPDAVLLDIGVSSLQLDTPDRGFSFKYNAPLDMRMSKELQVTAADLIGGLGRKELYDLLTKLGQEQHARRLADAIIESRGIKPITTTEDLATLISKTIPSRGKIHPATKAFQALRIAVNDELNELKAVLPSALSILKEGGILLVISFHSLEDRIVKQFFNAHKETLEILTPKPVTATEKEKSNNPRSRSAKLRAVRKLSKIRSRNT